MGKFSVNQQQNIFAFFLRVFFRKTQILLIKYVMALNPKWQPKIKMAAKVKFVTEKSTETPPKEHTLNYFRTQFVEY
jgi:hypothetical protein